MKGQALRRCGIVIIAFAATMLGIQSGATTSDNPTESSTAPGALIWVGKHRLHLNCIGQGSPTVVFDSGLGGNSLDWTLVQPQVAKFTRACTYDRAGYGWSDAGPLPRDSAHISRELATLLGNASVAAPYLLVGHSFGGFNIRLYSHNNPHQVAGLVLIDSSHEDQFRRFEAAGMESSAPRSNSFIVHNPFQVPAALPEVVAGVAKSFAAERSTIVAFRSELAHLRSSAQQLRNAYIPPYVPVVVISHRIEGTVGSTAELTRAKIWMDMQSDLVSQAINGHHLIAETQDHYVHLHQPELVVDSIRELVGQSRRFQ